MLSGPTYFCSYNLICKKQGAVSHSTAEAEVISLDASIRMEGLPALKFWDVVIQMFDPQNPAKSLKLLATKSHKSATT